MGTDCSQRVCPFGHAFVDTPQGDLNADGKVDRPDVFHLVVDTGEAISGSYSGEFPANTMIFSLDESANQPSILTSIATSVESVSATRGATNWVFNIPVTIPDRNMEADVHTMGTSADGALGCAPGAYTDTTQIADCKTFVTGTTPTSMNALSWSENVYTYATQFTNADTWELYPLNHAKGKAENELTRNFAEGHFYTECSGKGTCNRESGQCECYPGYEGVGCTRTSCPNDCSGHGVCQRISDKFSAYDLWDRKKTQLCTCDSGYTGIDCSQRFCPKGNDPITRPTSDVGNLLNTAYFSYLPHSDGQEPEIQTFGHVATLTSGHFALEFTDEFGDKWTTKTMDFMTANAKDVEAALEALPNKVIQDVSVSYRFLDNLIYTSHSGGAAVEVGPLGGDCSTHAADDTAISGSDSCSGFPRFFQVTFVSNSGNVPKLGVRYTVVEASGRVESDSNGAFTSLTACDDANLAGEVATPGSTEQSTCVFNDNAGVVGSYSPTTSNAIKTIGFGGAIASDLSGDDYLTLNGLTHGVYYNENGNIVVHNTGREGSQENELCSNRGICDYGTGLCSCFNGFTDDDCSVQNALAMY
jgi:hypothetical protein